MVLREGCSFSCCPHGIGFWYTCISACPDCTAQLIGSCRLCYCNKLVSSNNCWGISSCHGRILVVHCGSFFDNHTWVFAIFLGIIIVRKPIVLLYLTLSTRCSLSDFSLRLFFDRCGRFLLCINFNHVEVRFLYREWRRNNFSDTLLHGTFRLHGTTFICRILLTSMSDLLKSLVLACGNIALLHS